MKQRTKMVVLQAPTSDREYAEFGGDNALPQHLALARTLQQLEHQQQEDNSEPSSEMMPRSAFWAPITAQRFLDLFEKGGADDFFSSDWTDAELQARLGHVSAIESLQTVLVAFSGADESVPSHVDKRSLTERLCSAMNQHREVATPLYLEGANHNLSHDEQAIATFLDHVQQLLQKLA
jgi:hypothetical protein